MSTSIYQLHVAKTRNTGLLLIMVVSYPVLAMSWRGQARVWTVEDGDVTSARFVIPVACPFFQMDCSQAERRLGLMLDPNLLPLHLQMALYNS